MGPINYGILSPAFDLAGSLASGVKAGKQITDVFKEKEKEEQAELIKRQYKTDLEATFKNPTPESFAQLTAKYPGQKDAFKQSFDLLDEKRKTNEIQETGKVYYALMSGNNEVAQKIIDDRIIAMENAGEDTANLKNISDYMKVDPKGAAGYAGLVLSSVMGSEDFTKTFEGLGKEKRAAQLQPGELKKQEAELVKSATSEGLTKAQTKKALADVDKTNIETKKIVLELEKLKNQDTGVVTDPEKIFKFERDLRKELSSETADFTASQDAFRKIDAAENNAVGDLSLIFSFMKMLDPGSVVREGEFATAQNATGVSEKVQNIYNNILKGERLSPGQRKAFKGQAKGLFKASKVRADEVKNGLEKVVKNYGLNRNNVFFDDEEQTVVTPKGTEVTTQVTAPSTAQPVAQKSYLKYAR